MSCELRTRCLPARTGPLAFALLAAALIADLAVTLIATDEQFGPDLLGGVGVYAVFIGACVVTAIRLRSGKGAIIGFVTLILMLVEGTIGLVLAAFVLPSGYKAPIHVYIAHAVAGLAYCGGWVALVSTMWNSP